MLINGKPPLASGTLIVRLGETAAIVVEGEPLTLEFLNDSGATRSDVTGGSVRFYNSDSMIGGFAGFAGTLRGQPIQGTISTSFFNGEEAGTGIRVIHYTFVRV